MDRDTIIDGLRMTMDLFTFDPTTGEEKGPDDLNDLDRATYDACKGALEILERLDADSDTISRAKAIEALDKRFDSIPMEQTSEILMLRKDLRELPPANNSEIPNSSDTISRQAAIDTLRGYLVGKRCPDDGTLTCRLIENEVINKLPPAQPEIVRCGQCKYAEVADKEDAQDGYTCQFHRGSIWFSGSYCSWAERRTDE